MVDNNALGQSAQGTRVLVVICGHLIAKHILLSPRDLPAWSRSKWVLALFAVLGHSAEQVLGSQVPGAE